MARRAYFTARSSPLLAFMWVRLVRPGTGLHRVWLEHFRGRLNPITIGPPATAPITTPIDPGWLYPASWFSESQMTNLREDLHKADSDVAEQEVQEIG